MPGWPGGLGNRLQDGRAVVDNGLGDRLQDVWNYLKSDSSIARMADPRTSPFSPAAVARLFMDPAGEAGRQAETGRQLAAPFTQFNDPNVDPVKQGADLAMTVMGGSSVVPAAANELRMGIKAYHGSPHDFERFDASKLGTGEGAQAYGHGMYFAEREGVAKEYRNALSNPRVLVGGKPISNPNPVEDSALAYLEAANRDPDPVASAILHAKRAASIETHPSKLREYGASVADRLEQWNKKGIEIQPGGRMYEVDIAADPEHFLDWDKPLSEQPKAIQDAMVTPEASALRQQLDEVEAQKSALAGDRNPKTNMMRNEKRWFELARESDRLQGELSKVVTADMKGGYAYQRTPGHTYPIRAGEGEPWQQGGKTYEESLAMVGGDASRVNKLGTSGGLPASDALREAGIPGIKYLDQGSRGVAGGKFDVHQGPGGWYATVDHTAPSGFTTSTTSQAFPDEAAARAWGESKVNQATRNYVVFPGNEHLISILRKYGLPISAAGLAALSQLHPQEAQAAPLGDRLQRGK